MAECIVFPVGKTSFEPTWINQALKMPSDLDPGSPSQAYLRAFAFELEPGSVPDLVLFLTILFPLIVEWVSWGQNTSNELDADADADAGNSSALP